MKTKLVEWIEFSVDVDNAKSYDIHTQFQIDNSNILIREFEL